MAEVPAHRPWPPQPGDGWPVPSPEEVLAAKGENGYWPIETLAGWGIPLRQAEGNGRWVPVTRWREKLGALYRRELALRPRESRPWPPEENDGWPLPSPEEIAAAKGENGYWPEEKLEEWGVPLNPAPARWRETLERAYWRENIPAEVYELLGEAYDEEGVRIAWQNPWRGMKRWRMFEAWWEDPEQVRRALRPPTTEIVLAHIDGPGRIIIKLPMDPTIAAEALEALGPLGWSAMGDTSVLFEREG
jgi:hypothetical protein